jgi:hypothetical protein
LADLEGLTGRPHARGKGGEREVVPMGQEILRDGLKTWCGITRMHALPAWRLSDAASMHVAGCNAHHMRHGVGPRGAATRQGPRTAGPSGPEALANHLVQLDVRAWAAWCQGASRAVSTAGRFRTQGTGMVDGTERETTAPDEGGGPVPRTRQRTDTHGQGRALEGTV